MKLSIGLIGLIVCFLPVSAIAQQDENDQEAQLRKNSLRLRVEALYLYKLDDTNMQINQYDLRDNDISTLGFTSDLGYTRLLKKQLYLSLRFRLAMHRHSRKAQHILPYPLSLGLRAFEGQAEQVRISYYLQAGIQHHLLDSETLSAAFGVDVFGGLRPAQDWHIAQDYYEANLLSQAQYTAPLSLPKAITIGLGFNAQLYYFFVPQVGVGLELDYQLFRRVENENFRHLFEGSSRELGTASFFSLGLQYRW